MRAPALAAGLAAFAAVAILVALGHPAASEGASGCPATARAGFGALFVEGDDSPVNGCDERLAVVCTGGYIEVDVSEPPGAPPSALVPDDEGQGGYQPVPCGNVSRIVVLGLNEDDVIDLSAVTPAAGFGTNPIFTPVTTTLDGGDGSDTIIGSAFADRISQGNDGGGGLVLGNGGDDRLVGDSGLDRLFGGDGNDALVGIEGNDELDGGAGDDRLDSGPDADIDRGGAGNDRIVAGDGDDSVFGEAGADLAFGGNGKDKIDGGGGPDRLFGDAAADLIRGRQGDDLLVGGLGKDNLRGGPGNNRIRP